MFVSFMSAALAMSATCQQHEVDLSKQVSHSKVLERDVRGFIEIGELRRSKGLEVMPINLLCPSIRKAASELDHDRTTRVMLAKYGLTATRWVITAFALLKASDRTKEHVLPKTDAEKSVWQIYMANRRRIDTIIAPR